MRTSSTIYTCKIALESSKMDYKIIIFPLDVLFLYIDRKPRVSSLRWYAAYKNLLSGFKVISSLTTLSRQKFGKNVTPISLFISCLICHGLGIAGRIFTGSIWLKSRDSWLFISVKIMCINFVIYRDNII